MNNWAEKRRSSYKTQEDAGGEKVKYLWNFDFFELKYPDNAKDPYVTLNPFLGISVQLRLVFTVIMAFMTDDEKFNEKSIT